MQLQSQANFLNGNAFLVFDGKRARYDTHSVRNDSGQDRPDFLAFAIPTPHPKSTVAANASPQGMNSMIHNTAPQPFPTHA